MAKQTDPSAVVVPFGKHKGATVAELLAKDPQYADWVMAQGWVAERFAELHAAIATRGAGTDDTPEHNALQARFLDEKFRSALLRVCRPNSLQKRLRLMVEIVNWELGEEICKLKGRLHSAKDELSWLTRPHRYTLEEAPDQAKLDEANGRIAEVSEKLMEAGARWDALPSDDFTLQCSAAFEQAGVDVTLSWDWRVGDNVVREPIQTKIELKPTMGDDYPSIMRQMQRLGATVCIVGQYTGRGASEPQLRDMFAANGYTIVFVQEIEEEVRSHK